MFETIFELGINLVETLITIDFITRYLGGKYEDKRGKIGFIAAWILLFAELSIVNHITPFETVETCIHFGIIFIYSLVLLKGNVFLKLWICILIQMILIVNAIAINLLVCYIIGYDPNDMVSVFNTTRIITVVIVQITLFYLTRIILRHKYKNPMNIQSWLLLIIIPIISLISMTALMLAAMEHEEIRGYILCGMTTIIISNIITYYFFKLLNRNYEAQLRVKLLEQHNENTQKALISADAYVKQMRAFRHNASNQLTVIHSLISEKNYDKAQEYVESLIKNHLPDMQQYIHTDNDAFDAIMNAKIAVCNQKKVFTEVKVQENSLKQFDAVDISILFGNLMDNAIEAAENTQNRRITVDIKVKCGYFSLLISNSIDKSVLENNSKLETSKPDKELHGIGIKNIKSIVKKYDGMLQFYEQDDEFFCHILLDMVLILKQI